MHKLRVIRFLVFLCAAALPLPQGAHAAEDAAKAGKTGAPPRASQLPKMSFDGQPQNEAPSKSPGEPKKSPEEPKPDTKPKANPKESPKKTPASEEKPAEQAEDGKTGQPSPLSIPFVEGYDSLGLKIPDFDPVSGSLKSWYSIGTLRRLDDKIVELRDSYLELYKTDGSKEVSMDLPKASLDRFTRKVESKVPVAIWSDDFHITGATMELDTVSKEARLGGPVHVLIYQFKDEPSEEGDAEQTRDAAGGANRGEPQNGEARGAAAVKGEKIN